MDELHRAADKLHTEQMHLERALKDPEPNLDLSLSLAKKVRRASTIVVQQIAALRDQLHGQEADKR